MKENSKTHETVFDAHSHCGSGSSRVMEPLSVCAEKPLCAPGTDSSLWEEMWDARSVPSGNPLCKHLLFSHFLWLCGPCLWVSRAFWYAMLTLPATWATFPVVKFGNFSLKKEIKIAHEREGHWASVKQQLLERHMVSLSIRIHTRRQPGWRGIYTDLMDRLFTGPPCPQLPVCSSTVATIPPRVSTSLKI